MKLITIKQGGKEAIGAVIEREVLDFHRAAPLFAAALEIPSAMRAVLDQTIPFFDLAQGLVRQVENSSEATKESLREMGALSLLQQTPLLAPNTHPDIIFAHGKAYHSHVRDFDKEAANERPSHPPAGFIKARSSITGPNSPILIPSEAASMIDFEGELCVVFGRKTYQISRKDAWHHVAGFTIINDVSRRDWVPKMQTAQKADIATYAALNIMYKCYPTFCPMGPVIATKDEFSANPDFHLVTQLNNVVMQDSWTRDLIWSIPELIEFYSSIYVFGPGDLMSTGTPGGVGAGRTPPIFMKSGDIVSISVDGIGTLTNPVACAM
jgi:acylpyruvate hydrolase